MNDIAFAPLSADNRNGVILAAAPAADEQSGGTPILVRLLHIAKRWKWLIVASVAVCTLLGLIVTLLMTPIYTADATLEIQREGDKILNVRGVEPESTAVDMEFYQTQYGLLTSNSLAERIARNLHLQDDPAFFEMFRSNKIASELRANSARTSADQQRRIRSAGAILLLHMKVEPVRLSRLVRVKFDSPNAEFSARVVNTWTRAFIETTLERKFEATSYARNFLEQRLDQLRQKVEESERAVVRYATEQGIVNIPLPSSPDAPASSSERPLVADSLTKLNDKLNEAIAIRVTAQSRLQGSGGATEEALQNQGISNLRQRRAELSADYAKMMEQFEPSYPPAKALATQIRQLETSIAREEGRVRSTLQATYQAAVAQENALRNQVDSLRGKMLDLRGRTIQYNIYQREADTNRQLYDALLQRYKEIGVAGGVGVNNIAVVDTAQAPTLPSSPRLLLNLVLSILIGGVVGVVLALLLDQMDEAISNPNDVERILNVSLLGTIPKIETGALEAELGDRKSPLVEAYLTAQTSLAFTTDHGVPRTFAVTSTRPAEGKSTTSYALARSLARIGRRVVLIDVDMRSPSIHNFFQVPNTAGVSNFLSGNAELPQLIKRDAIDNLSFVPAGPMPPNAAELLSGDRIGQMIALLAEEFDHVVLDMPPVMGLADAPIIASHVEGTVFVLESHGTRSSVAAVSIGRLKDAHARILGVLLTKFEVKRAHYGYGYDYGYGYGQGAKKGAA